MIRILAKESVLERYGLDAKSFMSVVAKNYDADVKFSDDMQNKLYMASIVNEKGELLMTGLEKLRHIILESDDSIKDVEAYEDTAKQLIEYWPEGYKDVNGKRYYWGGNVKEITFRLQLFERRYGRYDDNDILDVAYAYIRKYDEDDTYMKTLKNFIMHEKFTNGYSFDSELYNLLEIAECKPIKNN